MLHVSALSFPASDEKSCRQTDTYIHTQTNYRMPRGSAHRGIIILCTIICTYPLISLLMRGSMTNDGNKNNRNTRRAVSGRSSSSHRSNMAGRENQYGPMNGTVPANAASTTVRKHWHNSNHIQPLTVSAHHVMWSKKHETLHRVLWSVYNT